MSLPPWVPSIETKPAPMPLLRVQSFVNTWESDTAVDLLADPDWLVLAGILPPGSPVDLEWARQVREAIRALLVANAGGPSPAPGELQPLRQLADRSRLAVDVGADGRVGLAAEATEPLEAGLAELLLVIRDAQADGSWERLKACRNDECRWAFFDRSHSRRGTWCDMATCGNRIKNRNLRERRR